MAAFDVDLQELENENAMLRYKLRSRTFEKQGLEEDKAALEEEKRTLTRSLSEHKERLDKLQDQARSSAEAHAQAEQKLQDAVQKVAELEKALTADDDDSEDVAQTAGSAPHPGGLAATKRQLKLAEAKLLQAESEAAETASTLSAVRKQYDELSAKVAARASSKLASDVALAKELKREQQLQAEIDRLRDDVAASQHALASKEAEKGALQAEMLTLQASGESRMASLKEASERDRADLQQQIAQLTLEAKQSSDKLSAAVFTSKMSQNLKDAKEAAAAPPPPSEELLAGVEMKLKASEWEARSQRYEEQVSGLEAESAAYRESIASLEGVKASQQERISELEADSVQKGQQIDEMKQSVAEMTESMEQNAHKAQSVMSEFQSNSQTQVREVAGQARAQAEALAQEYKQRAIAAEESLAAVQQAAEDKIASLQRGMQKLALKTQAPSPRKSPPRQQREADQATQPPPEPALPPEYATLRGELRRTEDAVLGLLHQNQAAELLALFDAAGEADPDRAIEVLRFDTRRLTELIEALGSMNLPSGVNMSPSPPPPSISSPPLRLSRSLEEGQPSGQAREAALTDGFVAPSEAPAAAAAPVSNRSSSRARHSSPPSRPQSTQPDLAASSDLRPAPVAVPEPVAVAEEASDSVRPMRQTESVAKASAIKSAPALQSGELAARPTIRRDSSLQPNESAARPPTTPEAPLQPSEQRTTQARSVKSPGVPPAAPNEQKPAARPMTMPEAPLQPSQLTTKARNESVPPAALSEQRPAARPPMTPESTLQPDEPVSSRAHKSPGVPNEQRRSPGAIQQPTTQPKSPTEGLSAVRPSSRDPRALGSSRKPPAPPAATRSAERTSPPSDHLQRPAQLPPPQAISPRVALAKVPDRRTPASSLYNPPRMSKSPTSSALLQPIPRAQSVPALPLHAGQPPGSQLSPNPHDLRPMRTAAELFARDARGATPLQRQQRMRRAWLSHSDPEADARADLVDGTCQCIPLFGPDSRPISQVPQARTRASPAEEAARSFWAQELPALVGSGKAMAVQSLAADAQELVLDALLSRDAARLDDLAAVLAELLGSVGEQSHPALVAAVRQVGVQIPTDRSERPLLAAPSRHDLVSLLAVLSNQTTYGSVAAPSASAPIDEADTSQLRRHVAELRRTLQAREEVDGQNAVTPRFSTMARAIISKEEQLQRTKEVLQSQRAANAAGLNRVRKQLDSLQGPDGEMHKSLRRMEDEHLKAAQRWDYKKTCLQQERTRLMEQAMEAFCKVVRVDRGWREHTAMHGVVGGDRGADQAAHLDVEALIYRQSLPAPPPSRGNLVAP